MATETERSGDELFIVDNSDTDWKMRDYLREWTEIARAMDIATGYFEIGALLALEGRWQKLDKIRILMGDEVTSRTRRALLKGQELTERNAAILDASLEKEKEKNDFLAGVPAIVEAMQGGKIECRVFAHKKFHAKAYITHARSRVVGSVALVGSSNFTFPGLSDNIELNVQLRREVGQLQDWYERHWQEAKDISPELLKIIQRHTAEYAPSEVYARALRELMRHHIPDVPEWEKTQSQIWPQLAKYQQDGYASLMQIARKHGGAFLCDGVGLGKTFVGMMVIERLLHDRKKVVLLSPKSAVDPVWGTTLRKYLPDAFGVYGGLQIFAHTDLGRRGEVDGRPGLTWERLWDDISRHADAIVIDEAHHFRNPGTIGGNGKEESRYRKLARLCEGKQMFLLTATPVNNSLRDLQHMIELFTGNKPDFFASSLGIHSLPAYFGDMEKKLERDVRGLSGPQTLNGKSNGKAAKSNGKAAPVEPEAVPVDVDEVEAEQVLRGHRVFRELVVQRSRGYARASQQQEAGSASTKIFPDREPPHVAAYSIKKTYGRLLGMVEEAFNKEKPLFALAIYYPLAYANEAEKARLMAQDKRVENQQKQVVGLIRTNFLKRFESSTRAFEISCARLLLKLLGWVESYVHSDAEKKRLERWKRDSKLALDYVGQIVPGSLSGEDEDRAPELDDDAGLLSRGSYKIDEILEDCFNDLGQIVDFLDELRKFKPQHDDKLSELKKLLRKDIGTRKVLIFTQFSDTAKYLQQQLEEAGFDGVDEIDSGSTNARNEVIQRFAPYYNGSSSPELKAKGLEETRILISTDVLSEGLNLQDATRLVNYDLHWNPVRLMQRIGRVDRRMNAATEARMVADNPALAGERGDKNTVAYWNFLPPDEMNELLTLYARVTHKTLRISKTFGIEGKKLLTPEDEFDALRDFTHILDGDGAGRSPLEDLSLEWQKMQAADAELIAKLDALPGRLFSGRALPPVHKAAGRAVFFCYILPTKREVEGGESEWTHEGGPVSWLLFDACAGSILETPMHIAEWIRSDKSTARRSSGEVQSLGEVRGKVEKHLRNTAIKSLGIPMGQVDKPLLRCWMELF